VRELDFDERWEEEERMWREERRVLDWLDEQDKAKYRSERKVGRVMEKAAGWLRKVWDSNKAAADAMGGAI